MDEKKIIDNMLLINMETIDIMDPNNTVSKTFCIENQSLDDSIEHEEKNDENKKIPNPIMPPSIKETLLNVNSSIISQKPTLSFLPKTLREIEDEVFEETKNKVPPGHENYENMKKKLYSEVAKREIDEKKNDSSSDFWIFHNNFARYRLPPLSKNPKYLKELFNDSIAVYYMKEAADAKMRQVARPDLINQLFDSPHPAQEQLKNPELEGIQLDKFVIFPELKKPIVPQPGTNEIFEKKSHPAAISQNEPIVQKTSLFPKRQEMIVKKKNDNLEKQPETFRDEFFVSKPFQNDKEFIELIKKINNAFYIHGSKFSKLDSFVQIKTLLIQIEQLEISKQKNEKNLITMEKMYNTYNQKIENDRGLQQMINLQNSSANYLQEKMELDEVAFKFRQNCTKEIEDIKKEKIFQVDKINEILFSFQ